MKASEVPEVQALLDQRDKLLVIQAELVNYTTAAVELVRSDGVHFVFSNTQPAPNCPLSPTMDTAVVTAVQSSLAADIAAVEAELNTLGVTEFDVPPEPVEE